MAIALAAGSPLFNGDYYTVDGISAKVRNINDWSSATHSLEQTANGQQVVLPVADANHNNRLTYDFTGGLYYASTRAASAWRFFSDGTGFDLLAEITAGAVTAGARPFSTRTTGAGTQFTMDGSTCALLVNNGSSTFINFGAVPVPAGGTYLTCGYKSGVTPQATIYTKGTQSAFTSSGTSPSAGDPQNTFALGATSAAGGASGKFKLRTLSITATWTAAQRDLWQKYVNIDGRIAP